MNRRALVTFAFLLTAASAADAGRPFGRRVGSFRASQPAARAMNTSRPRTAPTQVPPSVFQSPEKMTEIFGPSILIRGEVLTASARPSEVIQPQ